MVLVQRCCRRNRHHRAGGWSGNWQGRLPIPPNARHCVSSNILTRPVPKLAAEHADRVLDTVLAGTGIDVPDMDVWILHAGGRDVLLALHDKLGLGNDDLRYSAAMLRQYGNLSSAFIYFVLQAALADQAPGGHWWMAAFGAGFSSHGALLEVE
jgi:predicted naringenin-chalcone synthase